MAEVLFLALESPERFFKDSKKMKDLYEQWLPTLGDWTIDMADRINQIEEKPIAI